MSTERNKEVSRRYHDYKPEEMDDILTSNFVGHGRLPTGGAFTWNREQHRQHWTKQAGKTPAPYTVYQQVAEGDMVATRLVSHDGGEMLSLVRIEGGKIAELWEMYDTALAAKAREQKEKQK